MYIQTKDESPKGTNLDKLAAYMRTNLERGSRVHISRHTAEDRMQQRGFSVEDVASILYTGVPYKSEKGSLDGEWKINLSKTIRGREAAVALLVSSDRDSVTVLTVMWRDAH